MHCELLVPGLFGAPPVERLPALELLLARARRRHRERRDVAAWLQEAFELGDGPLAAGALTALAGGDDPGDANWIRADPVHLRVLRDHVATAPADLLQLQQAEADALCEALTRHFAGELQIKAYEPLAWSARLAKDSGFNDALLNEVQMLLHAHPVNEAREARGELPVNSVSLWGAGRVPASASSPWQSVSADDPAARGAARLGGARPRALPASASDWLERLPEDGRQLAVLDARHVPLAELEARWFAPLLAALRAQRVGMVTIHVPDAAEEVSFEAIRGDLRRFWRRAKPIQNYNA